MCIGRDTESGNPIYFLNGAIDEAAFYNRAATDSEIAAIYAADKALPVLGDAEDLDGDTLVNVMEHGLNTNRNVANAGPPPTTILDAFGDRHGVLTQVRDPRRTIESSGDLIDWVPIATSTAGQPFTGIATILGEVAGSAPRPVTIIDPYYGAKGFLRVRASR